MTSLLYQLLLLLRALGLKNAQARATTTTMITSASPMKVNMDNIIARIYTDVFNSNLIYLSAYRYQREKMYPGVGYRFFSDYRVHKVWMISETRNFSRMERNKEIVKKYHPKPKPIY